jgi:hypothetical protein
MGKVSRTTPYRNYIAPGKGLVKSTASDIGFDSNYSYPLVKDIANYLSHPEEDRDKAFTKPSEWDFDIPAHLYPTREHREREQRRRIDYNKNVQDFIKSMDFDKVDGETPLEQALNTVAALNASSGGGKGSPKQGSGKGGAQSQGTSAEGDGEGEMQIFRGGSAGGGDSIAKQTLERMEMLQKIEPNSFADKVFGGDKDMLSGVRATKISKEHLKLMDKIAVFDAHGKIKAAKRKTLEEDEFSKKKRHLMISRYNEVARVSAFNYAFPSFDYKMATKQLIREKGIKFDEARQCLVLLIDDSGSMCCNQKISWIKALLLNRCNEVEKGNAELYICCFETDLDPNWIVVRTPEEAKDVWDNFRSYFRLDGGGTDMQKCIDDAITILKSGQVPTKNGPVTIEGIRPQICIINDGQDHVDRGYIPSIETHGFILEGSHGEMKKFCKRSGGSYMEFWSDHDDYEDD